jgi:hypothetical protein
MLPYFCARIYMDRKKRRLLRSVGLRKRVLVLPPSPRRAFGLVLLACEALIFQ